MEKVITIYTETEKDFLISSCDLLKIEYRLTTHGSPLFGYDFLLFADMEQLKLITNLLKYNYERNIIA